MNVEDRARKSLGSSSDAIYVLVAGILKERVEGNTKLLDVGCGSGNLHGFVREVVDIYEGIDVVRYDNFPDGIQFHCLDLDSGRANLPDGYADFVVAVETIEHLENPRAFMRELVRLCRPDGWVVVTTPNQLSILSKLTLLAKNQFNAFTESNYPAHITALLESDLKRIASECGLVKVSTEFTKFGRLPGTAFHWPRIVSRFAPRSFSDNIALIGRRANP